ncbi:MAG: crosslink repair DNA glycosylase YcaQ family protein [Bacteroidota bacterium]
MKSKAIVKVDLKTAVNLWFHCQSMHRPRGSVKLTPAVLSGFLEKVGALQLDSINVVERAHYLTLWSRFGNYDKADIDQWIYQDKIAYEYWGHEASILPISHLPLGRRRMKLFPPESWLNSSWWKQQQTSPASKRRVLRRLRTEGPLESAHFEKTVGDRKRAQQLGAVAPVMPGHKEDKRSLQLLWHAGKVAVSTRRYFRRIYDLSERVFPETETVTRAAYHDSWLFIGLKGNGIATEKHLENYFTAPKLKAPERRAIIDRNLKAGRIVEVQIDDRKDRCFMLPEHVDQLNALDDPTGTTLVCPFDSFLWQRKRAEALLDFHYRIEIYVPQKKRQFGYYVLPILHDGKLVGRLDPKLHRDKALLEIKSIYLEETFKRTPRFDQALRETLHDLAAFVGAQDLQMPAGWGALA